MDIKELLKAVMPMTPAGPAPVQAPVAPQPVQPKVKKLMMDPALMIEGQKVFQPGAEHKQGSPLPPDSKGTSSKMEPQGWAGKANGQ